MKFSLSRTLLTILDYFKLRIKEFTQLRMMMIFLEMSAVSMHIILFTKILLPIILLPWPSKNLKAPETPRELCRHLGRSESLSRYLSCYPCLQFVAVVHNCKYSIFEITRPVQCWHVDRLTFGSFFAEGPQQRVRRLNPAVESAAFTSVP